MIFKFEWEDANAENNFKKHGISFEEAKTVFFDDYARTFDDIEHSIGELREIVFGYTNKNKLLIVSFYSKK